MKIKNKHFVIILIALTFYAFTNPNRVIEKNIMNIKTEIDGAILYQKKYKQFDYYIETIGTVSINDVKLENNQLTALYSYKMGNELRKVISKLNKDKDGIYKGTCTTTVNGKIIITVNTWLTFSENGTAKGNWSWSGKPTKNDPIVTISKS